MLLTSYGERYVIWDLCGWYLILIVGVGYLAHLMHIPEHYIVALVIMLGIGVVTGVQSTRQKDPS